MNDQTVKWDLALTQPKFYWNVITQKTIKKVIKKEEMVELVNPYVEFDVTPMDGFINGSCQTDNYREILTMKTVQENQSL